MMKLVSKFAMDIFPSVIATIVGAYIVNHYINVRPSNGGATAAAVAPAEPKKGIRTDSRPAEKSADLGNHIPEPGVRAKGISEKAISDKSSTEKPAEKSSTEKPAEKSSTEKPAEKADRPSETASIPPTAPAEPRRHQPTREKAASKTAPAAPAAPAEPVVAAPATAPPAETAAVPDANYLARAAIERLRGTEPPASRAAETTRTITAPAAASPAPPPPAAAGAPSLQPLPPPILVSAPPTTDSKPPAKRVDDPLHPTPPADIPESAGAPLDLRADAAADAPPPPKGRPSVADDVLSAAKSMFHSVLPK